MYGIGGQDTSGTTGSAWFSDLAVPDGSPPTADKMALERTRGERKYAR
jgi:hypothetical protein